MKSKRKTNPGPPGPSPKFQTIPLRGRTVNRQPAIIYESGLSRALCREEILGPVRKFNSPGIWEYQKFAGPPAHGVSEPRHQYPVPVHWSLRVLDSSSGVQGDTIYGVLGGWPRTTLLPTQALHFWKGSKNNPEVDHFLNGFLEPRWLQLGSENPPESMPRCLSMLTSFLIDN